MQCFAGQVNSSESFGGEIVGMMSRETFGGVCLVAYEVRNPSLLH
jgi:hypothetical protein